MPKTVTKAELKKDPRGRPLGSKDKEKRKPGTGLHDNHKTNPSMIVATDEDLQLIYELARDGYPRLVIARRIGISNSTLDKWMERDPKVRAAWEYGIAEDELLVGSGLRATALDRTSRQHVAASIFYLSAKHGWRNQAAVQVEQKEKAPTKYKTTDRTPSEDEQQ